MHVDRKFSPVVLAVVSLFFASAYSGAQARKAHSASTVIKQVDVRGENGAATVRVRGLGPLAVHTERLTAPDRLVMDFTDARMGAVPPDATTAVGPVRGIRVGQFKPDVARVVLDLDGPAEYQIETGDGSVTVVFSAVSAKATPAPAAPKSAAVTAASAAPVAVPAVKANPVPAVKASPAPSASKTAATPFFDVNAPGYVAPAPRPAAGSPVATAVAMEAINTSPNSFQNGLLTFRAKDRPLKSVLDDIGGISSVPIIVGDGLGSEQVSAEFHSYRLDEALRQILKDYDVLYSYGSGNDSQGNPILRTVWVYAPNHGPGMGRFTMAAWNTSARQYEQTLTTADPDERARAVDELIRRDGRDAVSVVMEALKDPSEKVRYQALYRAVLVGALPPEDTIIDLVLNDSAEGVRVWAFQTLPLDPTLRWVAMRASGDSNQQIAELAKNYLKDLDGSTGAAAPQGQSQTTPQPAQQQPISMRGRQAAPAPQPTP